MYRREDGRLEVLLVHPGGPFWARKDAGAWSIPKGEFEPGEDPLETAKREFEEELGSTVSGELTELGRVKQSGGKVVHAWTLEGNFNPAELHSNTFEMEWPPRSGRMQSFPEVDRAEWFTTDQAAEKINPAQRGFLVELVERLQA